ncbi:MULTISPECIES: WhiB family transcriptional regulator [Streptomyces]
MSQSTEAATRGPEPYGVWGGMSEGQRRQLRQLRPRRVVAAESETPESE